MSLHTFSPGALAFRTAFFGQGTGRILLDNLGCNGAENRLVDCPHNGIGIENCVHAEDAGLRCAGMCGSHTSVFQPIHMDRIPVVKTEDPYQNELKVHLIFIVTVMYYGNDKIKSPLKSSTHDNYGPPIALAIWDLS